MLAQYLTELGSSFLSGARVIELGAGTGLVGMVASTLGKLVQWVWLLCKMGMADTILRANAIENHWGLCYCHLLRR